MTAGPRVDQPANEPSGSAPADSFDRLSVGYTDRVVKTIRREDVDAFAALSGDYNALHVDDEFAARTEFEQRVVHGFLHASLLSTLVGMKIPGPGALYLSQTIDFTRPVFIDDTITAVGTVTSVDQPTRVIGIKTEIVNQHGQTVLNGEARVKVLRLAAASSEQPRKASSMSDLLSDRVALVTGASRGIGRSIASELAAHGAKVWINYHRSEQAAQALAAEIAAAASAARWCGRTSPAATTSPPCWKPSSARAICTSWSTMRVRRSTRPRFPTSPGPICSRRSSRSSAACFG
jgi:3-oxoacyl-[acyl-carrier protein] reductase